MCKIMCGQCSKISGWIFIVLGILFLLGDFGVLPIFGETINWYSALFLIGGIIMVCSGYCSNCNFCCSDETSTKKSKR